MKILGTNINVSFISTIFTNFPEASTETIVCQAWSNTSRNGRRHYYDFVVYDLAGRARKRLRVRFPHMVRGLELFMMAKARGELAGVEWTRERTRNGHFSADYDRVTVDAIAQFALFGKVIY